MLKQQMINELKYALEFTKTYKTCQSKAIREVLCLQLQLSHILLPISDEDLIAGRQKHTYLGFSCQYGGVYIYFFHDEWFQKEFDEVRSELDDDMIAEVEDMAAFWRKENTRARLDQSFFDKYGYYHPYWFKQPGITNCACRIAGMEVDLDKLIRLGVPGLREEISKYAKASPDNEFYTALLMALELMVDTMKHYEQEALSLAKNANGKRKKQLLEIASNLKNIQESKPMTFKEGLQLFWIYAVVADLMDFGRMDVYLGDLYAQDIDNGSLTEEEAIEYLTSMYRIIVWTNIVYDMRIIIGGKGRRNEKNADRLAMVLMEVSARVKEVIPQLTLRYYKGMNDEVYEKALKVNALGTTFPIIYSDDTNIPAVAKVYDVPIEEAEQYVPFGCGEYVLEGLSTGTPNNGVNLLKALEMVLFNGYDHIYKMPVGQKTGDVSGITSFDELWRRYEMQLAGEVERIAWQKMSNYRLAGEQADVLYFSMLMNDCIARGKGLVNGGVRYLNASSEVFGIISCADSFTAIKKVVFEDKLFTMEDLVKMLAADFEGYEQERKILQNAPKYGNDDDYADQMAIRVFEHIEKLTREAGDKAGIHKYDIVSVNNSMSAEWGEFCMASADGRKKGTAMSNGNGPSIGADKNGITALMNSMSKFDHTNHVGVINNIRFSREMFDNSFDKVKSLISTFLENNATQVNLTVIGKDDLKQAVLYPEKYQNLIVRIGGFSARFVTLDKVIQQEIIDRTTYAG